MLYLEASFLHCLHVATSFLGLQSHDLGSSPIVFQGMYISRVPWADQLPQFLYLDCPYCVELEIMSIWAQLPPQPELIWLISLI